MFSQSKKYLLTALVLLLASILATPALASDIRQELSKQSMVEQVLQRGILRVGMSTFVPWAMKDKTGKLIGFEIDVARRLAEDMGVEIAFIPTKWSGIIPALLTGKFDIIIGGMGIRPNRNLKVNFSIPYDHTGMSLVANKRKAAKLTTLESYNSKDVTISARIGTTAVQAAKRFFPKAQLSLFDDEAQAVQEVLNGRAYAFVTSDPTPAFLAIKHSKRLFLPLTETFTKEPIGFALRKGDIDAINFVDNWILYVQAEGWLKERRAYWFGSRDWEKLVQ